MRAPLDRAELTVACSTWDGSGTAFADIVRGALACVGLDQHELATLFQVADSTVSRWASGTARPHPRLQKRVIAAILERAGQADLDL
jgi:ribosome-binding protein aMBF1 (putative translation factor)